MTQFARVAHAAAVAMVLLVAAGCSGAGPGATAPPVQTATPGTLDRSDVGKLIGEWPNRPRLGAVETIAKYGERQEATSQQLIWHNPGPERRNCRPI